MEMLDFVMSQWRNVRQRNVAPTAIEDVAYVKLELESVVAGMMRIETDFRVEMVRRSLK